MKNIISIKLYKSTVGEILLGSINNKLCIADWKYRKKRDLIDNRIKKFFNADYVEETSEVIEHSIIQLNEYFNNDRIEFNLQLAFAGTDFQISVWQELIKVPFGKTETYLGLSKKLGNEKAVRAVASANGANSISIIVPCHRIIGSNGNLVGYAGGLNAKKKLLELESDNSNNSKQLNLFSE